MTTTTRRRIWLSPPHVGDDERTLLQEAFDSNWIAPVGPQIDAFESELAGYVGVESAAVVSSGTAALHLALDVLGVGPGDEVLVPTFTFIASASPVLYQGATPVFVDSEPTTWNLSPALLEKAIEDGIRRGKKAKAVVLVHLYGMPCRLEELCAIARRYEIAIVEDAAEALGSRYGGHPVGGFGDLAVLSFNGNKIITTSGGGALLGNDRRLVERARFLATQAREDAPHYEHKVVGYNYRMSNLLAALGRAQLRGLDPRVERRRAIHRYYLDRLSGIEGISFVPEPPGSLSNRWLTTIRVKPGARAASREGIRLGLLQDDIESRPVWKPLHLQPVFEGAREYTDGTAAGVFDEGLCLPSGSSLEGSDLDRICSKIEEVTGID